MPEKILPLAYVDFNQQFYYRGRYYRMPNKEMYWLKGLHESTVIEVVNDEGKPAKFKKDTLVKVSIL
jgi:hypothetical protein